METWLVWYNTSHLIVCHSQFYMDHGSDPKSASQMKSILQDLEAAKARHREVQAAAVASAAVYERVGKPLSLEVDALEARLLALKDQLAANYTEVQTFWERLRKEQKAQRSCGRRCRNSCF